MFSRKRINSCVSVKDVICIEMRHSEQVDKNPPIVIIGGRGSEVQPEGCAQPTSGGEGGADFRVSDPGAGKIAEKRGPGRGIFKIC